MALPPSPRPLPTLPRSGGGRGGGRRGEGLFPADVAAADEAQAIADLRPDLFRHRRRLAGTLPFRAFRHLGPGQVIERHITRVPIWRESDGRRERRARGPAPAGARYRTRPGTRSRPPAPGSSPPAAARQHRRGRSGRRGGSAHLRSAAGAGTWPSPASTMATDFRRRSRGRPGSPIPPDRRDRRSRPTASHRWHRSSAATTETPSPAALGNVLVVVPVVEFVRGDVEKSNASISTPFAMAVPPG